MSEMVFDRVNLYPNAFNTHCACDKSIHPSAATPIPESINYHSKLWI